MKQKFEQFSRAVSDYPEFKDQFRSFCKTSTENFSNNHYLPGVLFSIGDNGATSDVFSR